MKLILASLLLIGVLSPTSDQNRRIRKLEGSLMAPCCYSQTIDVHMSTEAAQMRDEVSNMVLTGKSDDEILRFYRAKYGETILVVPAGTAGLLAFGIPTGVALLALALTFWLAQSLCKRSVRASTLDPAQMQSASPEMLERIRRDLQVEP
jgi:cytochrome c-type biogenesis protein CcmH